MGNRFFVPIAVAGLLCAALLSSAFAEGMEKELLKAAKSGKLESVRELLRKGADADARGRDGWTPLIWASKEGHARVVEILLKKGADPRLSNQWGWFPLTWAAIQGHSAIVELLLKHGADVNAKSERVWTAKELAAEMNHKEVVKILEARDARAESRPEAAQAKAKKKPERAESPEPAHRAKKGKEAKSPEAGMPTADSGRTSPVASAERAQRPKPVKEAAPPARPKISKKPEPDKQVRADVKQPAVNAPLTKERARPVKKPKRETRSQPAKKHRPATQAQRVSGPAEPAKEKIEPAVTKKPAQQPRPVQAAKSVKPTKPLGQVGKPARPKKLEPGKRSRPGSRQASLSGRGAVMTPQPAASAGGGTRGTARFSAKPSPGGPYKDDKGRFEVAPPPGWKRQDFPEETVRSRVLFHDPTNRNIGISVICTPTGKSGDKLREEASKRIEDLQSKFQDGDFKLQEEKLGKHKTLVMLSSLPGAVHQEQVRFIDNGIMYSISFHTTTKDQFDKDLPAFRKFMDTFKPTSRH